jgi:hypothetical protein
MDSEVLAVMHCTDVMPCLHVLGSARIAGSGGEVACPKFDKKVVQANLPFS